MESVRIARCAHHVFSSRDEDAVVLFLHDETSGVVGKAFFLPEDEPLPPAEQFDGVVTLYFRRSQLADVLGLLRSGGAVELRWDGPFDTCLAATSELSAPSTVGAPG